VVKLLLLFHRKAGLFHHNCIMQSHRPVRLVATLYYSSYV